MAARQQRPLRWTEATAEKYRSQGTFGKLPEQGKTDLGKIQITGAEKRWLKEPQFIYHLPSRLAGTPQQLADAGVELREDEILTFENTRQGAPMYEVYLAEVELREGVDKKAVPQFTLADLPRIEAASKISENWTTRRAAPKRSAGPKRAAGAKRASTAKPLRGKLDELPEGYWLNVNKIEASGTGVQRQKRSASPRLLFVDPLPIAAATPEAYNLALDQLESQGLTEFGGRPLSYYRQNFGRSEVTGSQGFNKSPSQRRWQGQIASRTGPGVNAAQAAQQLDPEYTSQEEATQQFQSQTGYRSPWQQAVSQRTGPGVNAAQAAQDLEQGWTSREEAGGQGSTRRSPAQQRWSSRVASRTGPGVNAAQAAQQLDAGYTSQEEARGSQGSASPRSRGSQGSQGSRSPRAGSSRQSGASREQWQSMISSRTGPGVNAAQAAQQLDPVYTSQREARGSSPRSSSQGSSQGGRNSRGSSPRAGAAPSMFRVGSRSPSRSPTRA